MMGAGREDLTVMFCVLTLTTHHVGHMIYEYFDLNSMMLSGYHMTEMQEEELG